MDDGKRAGFNAQIRKICKKEVGHEFILMYMLMDLAHRYIEMKFYVRAKEIYDLIIAFGFGNNYLHLRRLILSIMLDDLDGEKVSADIKASNSLKKKYKRIATDLGKIATFKIQGGSLSTRLKRINLNVVLEGVWSANI